jgi:hypothetical protein
VVRHRRRIGWRRGLREAVLVEGGRKGGGRLRLCEEDELEVADGVDVDVVEVDCRTGCVFVFVFGGMGCRFRVWGLRG